MSLQKLLCLFVLCMAIAVNVSAKKKSKPYFKLVEAYTQRTLPGIPRASIKTDYRFILVWEGANYPETFFWRGDNGWLTCSMVKAHRIAHKNRNAPEGQDYSTEFVKNGDVHKGDTLELTPIAGGKFPVPAEIPADAKKTLFYKTGGSGWLPFPVNTITKKPDMVMQ